MGPTAIHGRPSLYTHSTMSSRWTHCLLLTSPEAPGKVVGRFGEALVHLGVALVARVDEVCCEQRTVGENALRNVRDIPYLFIRVSSVL